jgi:hypothetical protein
LGMWSPGKTRLPVRRSFGAFLTLYVVIRPGTGLVLILRRKCERLSNLKEDGRENPDNVRQATGWERHPAPVQATRKPAENPRFGKRRMPPRNGQ